MPRNLCLSLAIGALAALFAAPQNADAFAWNADVAAPTIQVDGALSKEAQKCQKRITDAMQQCDIRLSRRFAVAPLDHLARAVFSNRAFFTITP